MQQISSVPNLYVLLSFTYYFVYYDIEIRSRSNFQDVGNSAFAHKGGVHIDAMIKNPLAYEHIDPKIVGNHRRFVSLFHIEVNGAHGSHGF